MPIPESERVVYGQNPLVEVICQLRFPPILTIGAKQPADFQERIRDTFPLYRERRALAELPADVPPRIAEFMGAVLPSNAALTYEFVTEDKRLAVALANDFLALTSMGYQRWEDSWGVLELALDALKDCYRPKLITRVGLRHKNLLRRSAVGLDGKPWSRLLQPHVLGELGSDDIQADVLGARRELLLSMSDGDALVMMRHGLEQSDEPPEQCYSIDSDFSRDARTEIGDVAGTLDRFHREAGHLFRWCITEDLHAALEPRDLQTHGGDDLGG